MLEHVECDNVMGVSSIRVSVRENKLLFVGCVF